MRRIDKFVSQLAGAVDTCQDLGVPFVIGAGASELRVVADGKKIALECPECGARVQVPTTGIVEKVLWHEADCDWVDSLGVRVPRKGRR